MDIKILEETGFSKREAKIYLKLLELGATTSGPLIDKTDVPSSKIYEVLNRLEEKGLVAKTIPILEVDKDATIGYKANYLIVGRKNA